MTKKTKDLVIFIERNILTFSGGSFEKPIKMIFDNTVVSDLEIVDKKIFVEKIVSEVKHSEFPVNLILVFSDDSVFSKELSLTSTKEQLEIETKTFLNLMPFDKVAHRLIKFTNNYKLIGVNGNMCFTLSDALLAKGYNLSIVIPVMLIPNFSLNSVIPDSIKDYSLIESRDNNVNQNKSNSMLKKSYLAVLVGVFILLIFVFLILIVKRST